MSPRHLGESVRDGFTHILEVRRRAFDHHSQASDGIGAVARKVLGDDRYLRRARALEVSYAQRDGVAEIGALIDEVVTERSAAVTS